MRYIYTKTKDMIFFRNVVKLNMLIHNIYFLKEYTVYLVSFFRNEPMCQGFGFFPSHFDQDKRCIDGSQVYKIYIFTKYTCIIIFVCKQWPLAWLISPMKIILINLKLHTIFFKLWQEICSRPNVTWFTGKDGKQMCTR